MKNNFPDSPTDLFHEWFQLAEEKEHSYPGAMTLATVTPEGKPAARVVLMRGFNERGCIFTPITKAIRGAHWPPIPTPRPIFTGRASSGKFGFWARWRRRARTSRTFISTIARAPAALELGRPNNQDRWKPIASWKKRLRNSTRNSMAWIIRRARRIGAVSELSRSGLSFGPNSPIVCISDLFIVKMRMGIGLCNGFIRKNCKHIKSKKGLTTKNTKYTNIFIKIPFVFFRVLRG